MLNVRASGRGDDGGGGGSGGTGGDRADRDSATDGGEGGGGAGGGKAGDGESSGGEGTERKLRAKGRRELTHTGPDVTERRDSGLAAAYRRAAERVPLDLTSADATMTGHGAYYETSIP